MSKCHRFFLLKPLAVATANGLTLLFGVTFLFLAFSFLINRSPFFVKRDRFANYNTSDEKLELLRKFSLYFFRSNDKEIVWILSFFM